MALVLQPRLQIHALLQGWVEAWAPHPAPRTFCRIEALGAGTCRARDVGDREGRGTGPVPTSERLVIEGHTVKGGATSG